MAEPLDKDQILTSEKQRWAGEVKSRAKELLRQDGKVEGEGMQKGILARYRLSLPALFGYGSTPFISDWIPSAGAPAKLKIQDSTLGDRTKITIEIGRETGIKIYTLTYSRDPLPSFRGAPDGVREANLADLHDFDWIFSGKCPLYLIDH